MLDREKRISYFSQMLGKGELKEVFRKLDKVSEFEEKFAKYIGCDYAILTGSGASALNILLSSIGLKKKDQVVMPALSCKIVPKVVSLFTRPKFSEIETISYGLDSEKLKFGDRTKIILPIHLYGNSVLIDELRNIADRKNIFLLEDCAHSLGGTFKNKKLGSYGDASIFSLRKNLAVGVGGVITTNDKKIEKKIRIVKAKVETKRSKKLPQLFGLFSLISSSYFKKTAPLSFTFFRMYRWDDLRKVKNFNQTELTNLETSIALSQLKKIDNFNRINIKNAEYLTKIFSKDENIITPKKHTGAKPIFTRYAILFKNNVNLNSVVEDLRKEGFDTGMIYNREFEYNTKKWNGKLPFTKNISSRLLPVGVPLNLSRKDLDLLKEIVIKHANS